MPIYDKRLLTYFLFLGGKASYFFGKPCGDLCLWEKTRSLFWKDVEFLPSIVRTAGVLVLAVLIIPSGFLFMN